MDAPPSSEVGAELAEATAKPPAARTGPPPGAIMPVYPRDQGVVCKIHYYAGHCVVFNCPFLHVTNRKASIPHAVCNFFLRQKCLRSDCPFFHGDDVTLSRLHASGATTYNPAEGLRIRDPTDPTDRGLRTVPHTTVLDAMPRPPPPQLPPAHMAPPAAVPPPQHHYPPMMGGPPGFEQLPMMAPLQFLPPGMTGYTLVPTGRAPPPPLPAGYPFQPPLHHYVLHAPGQPGS